MPGRVETAIGIPEAAARTRISREPETRRELVTLGRLQRYNYGHLETAVNRLCANRHRCEEATATEFLVQFGDRIRVVMVNVERQGKGPQLLLSRASELLVMKLFEMEVPEIYDGTVTIVSVSRDAGERSKVAVQSKDRDVDPVGACVGMRGSRVQSVSNEIGGERVDIILWNEDPAQFVINAMSPAEVLSLVVDEEARSMNIAVDEEKLAMAIGRGGQNIRLASDLTGWELNVMTEQEAEAKNAEESAKYLDIFTEHLDVDTEVAEILAFVEADASRPLCLPGND